MFCLIKSDEMRIMGYHPQWEYMWEACCAFAHEDGHVIPLRPEYFDDYSLVDLQTMYINLTNDQKGFVAGRDLLVKAIIKIVSTLKMFSISIGKLQSMSLATLGSGKDTPLDFSITISEEFKASLLAGNVEPKWQECALPYFTTTEKDNHINPVSSSRSTGTRDLIWEVATQMWKDTGSNMDKSAILLLRRDIMTELEKQGVNRNSASNELGRWQKQLLES